MEFATFYNYIMEEVVDPRTKDWFLVHSPVPLALIFFSWGYFVFVCGPKYMKDKEPYVLKTYIRLYNIFQIISNAAVVYVTLTSGWTTSFGWGCERVNTSMTGEGYRMAAVGWWVYIIKLIDLTETMVYVLRKKDQQLSVLHIYHHISTALLAWMSVKWSPGGMISSVMLINCFIHVIMYTYYLMSAGGTTLQKLVRPIKPWITILQMAQFCILIVHLSQGFAPSCHVPKVFNAMFVINLLINFYLFYDFYTKSYTREKLA